MERWSWRATACLSLLVALASLVMTRDMYLDDAFIHLRIARHLAESGTYSFNEGAPSFSTSSVLYTG